MNMDHAQIVNAGTMPGAKPCVLIVDDCDVSREMLKNIFSGHYVIDEAADGEAAIGLLSRNPERYVALFLDLVMPKKGGLEVLRSLHERGLTSKIAVFLIAADANEDVVSETFDLGVMDVLRKPIIPRVVLHRVQNVVELFLARKRLSRTVEAQQEELLRQAHEIIELNNGIISSLATAIEFRSGESGEHVRRIRDITRFMLTQTGFAKLVTPREAQLVADASVMHDVGKIAISDAILNKSGPLTSEEYEIMKTHAIQGARILEQIPQLHSLGIYAHARDIALHHHERWDGRGYPDGLKGDECSIEAQIVGLADVYDALLTKRVYKDALPEREAVRMIRDGECGVFNPELLEEFAKCERELHQHVYVRPRESRARVATAGKTVEEALRKAVSPLVDASAASRGASRS